MDESNEVTDVREHLTSSTLKDESMVLWEARWCRVESMRLTEIKLNLESERCLWRGDGRRGCTSFGCATQQTLSHSANSSSSFMPVQQTDRRLILTHPNASRISILILFPHRPNLSRVHRSSSSFTGPPSYLGRQARSLTLCLSSVCSYLPRQHSMVPSPFEGASPLYSHALAPPATRSMPASANTVLRETKNGRLTASSWTTRRVYPSV